MTAIRQARDEWIALRSQLGEPAALELLVQEMERPLLYYVTKMQPRSAFWAASACVWFLFGGIDLLKHFINRSRVEQLKEIKRVELEVLKLREALQGRTAG